MYPRMTHICLHVDALDECVQFYRRYCHLEVIDDRSVDGEGSVYLGATGGAKSPVIQLMGGGQSRERSKTDESHFGFVVESRERVDVIAEAAEQEGVLLWDADEYLPGAYLCVLQDPNGNGVEFGFGHPVPPGPRK